MSLVAYASSGDDSQSDGEEETADATSLPKKREPVKISIPSLEEFAEEEKPDPIVKPKSKGGSGLFSILPPPKNSTTFSRPGFTPYVFSKKKEVKTSPQIKKQIPSAAPTKSDKLGTISNTESSAVDDSLEKVDFFSLNTETVAETKLSVSENSADSLIGQVSAISAPVSNNYSVSKDVSSSSWTDAYPSYETSATETSSSSIDWGSLEMRTVSNPSEADETPDFLKDEEFKKLKGRKELENINIIDVNADDQLTGKDQWIMQSLTQETYRPMKRRHDMPTSQQKRKHQITYLAFQAKERELDLKNQWAHNNRTRRETQAKYGF